VANLSDHDDEMTIYAKEPWTCDSEALLSRESGVAGVPEGTASDAAYFIEVCVAKEFLEGWRARRRRTATAKEQCERLIQYAINDA
jgi:hypothetical protein